MDANFHALKFLVHEISIAFSISMLNVKVLHILHGKKVIKVSVTLRIIIRKSVKRYCIVYWLHVCVCVCVMQKPYFCWSTNVCNQPPSKQPRPAGGVHP